MKKTVVALVLLLLVWTPLYGQRSGPPAAYGTGTQLTSPKRWDADSTRYWLANVFHHHSSFKCSLNAATMDTVIKFTPPAWFLIIQNMGDSLAHYAFTAENTIGKEAYKIPIQPGHVHVHKEAFRADSFFVWWDDSTYVWANAFTPEGEGS